MNLLIFKTNIRDQNQLCRVGSHLDSHPLIMEWSIDTDDIDNVLRIEGKDRLTIADIAQLINRQGFQCEDLPD